MNQDSPWVAGLSKQKKAEFYARMSVSRLGRSWEQRVEIAKERLKAK